MYFELHARSAFSFLEGASLPEGLIAECLRLKMPAMALLDRDGVYGAPRFHMAAKKAGIKAHIGADVTCAAFDSVILSEEYSARSAEYFESKNPYAQKDRKKVGSPRSARYDKGLSRGGKPFRLPLLAESRTGYQNLCRLITKAKLRARKEESIAWEEELREHAAGIICLTGGDEGPLAAARASGGTEEARRCVERLTRIFGQKNVYVELQRHFHRDQEVRNQAAIEIARRLHLPLLASNGVCYASARERELCDVFTAIRNHRTLETAGRLLARNSERHLKSPQEMQQLFADLPEAITNTVELSSRLEFTLEDLGYEFPRYPVPEGENMMSFLRERTREGFERRYGRAEPGLKSRAQRQIERELKLIAKLELAGYFLIVWDLVRYCREQKILVQGRGSAANSAVCYSLGITAVDPVGMDLLFERFLSEERGEWPDIDLDLPSGDQRERVIQYLYQRYGERGAAMTANVITYRNRMAAREMGKALGFDAETLDKVSTAVAGWEYRDAGDALDQRFHDAGLDLNHPRLRKYFELCLAVQDLPRHLGQHSGGMVICQGQLDSVVPLEPASMPGRVVVQWDKEDCADLGIIKVDLLGLGMMAVLEDSIEIIRKDYGEEVDLAHLPAGDPEVYGALQKADTIGMFQIESRAQMSCLPRLCPKCFYDIVVQVAIIRPGPIVGQMVNPYLQRRMGREKVTYAHESLEPVLARTLGVPLFQEQLLRMAMVVANFSGGEAEELRRAMGFKRSQARMKEIETRLRAGMKQNGIARAAQEQIILSVTSFALYGFPESHAASFALIAYASAFLKCHYLAAFTAALLNNQPMGFYHPSTIVKDAQRHGLKVLPIDVTKSEWECTLEQSAGSSQQSALSRQPDCHSERSEEPAFEGTARLPIPRAFSPRFARLPAARNDKSQLGALRPALRLGLRYARGLREAAALALVEQRKSSCFASVDDLVGRVPELRKDELNTLAEAGALNTIGERFHRRDALWQVERAVRRSGPLLDKITEADIPSPLLPMNAEERLVADFRGTGLTVGPHPMAYHRARMESLGIRKARELRNTPNGQRVRVGGCVIARQRPGTAKGFVFLSLEDETGVANAIITPGLFQRNRLLLTGEKFLLVEGALQNQDGVISVKAERVAPLSIPQAETSSHDFH
ncbi:MAG TPA: error-prone DNA polymerase [Terriglobales bacterium]|nr:error-prone DNA polymerase [Terriglobales bacterium]